MHILEFIESAESKVSAPEIVEAEISHLLARMYDFQQFLTSEHQQKTIDSWRNELVMIRHVIDVMFQSK